MACSNNVGRACAPGPVPDAFRFADGERVVYAEIGDEFLEADGSISPTIMPDALHLSAEGYQRWAKALEPLLQEAGL